MARTALTVNALTEDAQSADFGTWENADAANGNIVEQTNLDHLLILATNPGASAADVVVAQADRGPQSQGLGGGPGDLTIQVDAGETRAIVLSSARFGQATGEETGEVAGVYLDVTGAGAADVDFLCLELPG